MPTDTPSLPPDPEAPAPRTKVTMAMPAEAAAKILADPAAFADYAEKHGFPGVEILPPKQPEQSDGPTL